MYHFLELIATCNFHTQFLRPWLEFLTWTWAIDTLHSGRKSHSIALTEISFPIVHCNEVFGFVFSNSVVKQNI